MEKSKQGIEKEALGKTAFTRLPPPYTPGTTSEGSSQAARRPVGVEVGGVRRPHVSRREAGDPVKAQRGSHRLRMLVILKVSEIPSLPPAILRGVPLS